MSPQTGPEKVASHESTKHFRRAIRLCPASVNSWLLYLGVRHFWRWSESMMRLAPQRTILLEAGTRGAVSFWGKGTESARRQYPSLPSWGAGFISWSRGPEARAIIYRAREEESRRRSLDRSIRLLDRAIALVETRRVTPYQFEDAGETYGEMLKDVRRGLIEQLDKYG